MSDETLTIDELRERLEEVRVAMVTTVDPRGMLASRPMTLQRVDDHGDLYFIVAADADWTVDDQLVNVALVDEGRTWVSIGGRAQYIRGTSLLSDLWDDTTDTFFPDGPESAVAMHVHADRWEYWTAPNRVAQMVQLAKAYVMDERPDLGDRGTIET
ncbi:MAG: pyridoxamine 5'-phosphate oxidase family protein [Ilumatobacter sp.]|nr:pyridoxamine 5'-phosphate oxidase family protein [Ilumatobacter sp.]